MKTRTSVLFLTVLLAAAVVVCSAAEDVQMGTWRLNAAKSQIGPGLSNNTRVVYAAAGENIKVTIDGVDTDGTPTHNEWTGKFDGKDYPVVGDPTSDTRSYKKVNDHTLALTEKKGGKVILTGLIVVSEDSKVRTVNLNGRNAMGKHVSISAVYDKQ